MNLFNKAKITLENLKADGWLISCVEGNDINSQFLLNIQVHIRHYIFISKDGNHLIITCPMERPMVQKALKRLNIDAEVTTYNSYREIPEILAKLIDNKTIALNFGENLFTSSSTEYAEFITAGEIAELKKIAPNTNFISSAPIIFELRSIKTQDDINDISEAIKINLEILEDIPNWVKIGMTENEVKKKLESKYLEFGELSFPAIVGNNENSADPHHNGSNKKIEKGVLLIDSGMKPNRMCTDITWTYWIGGNPTEDFLNVYHTLYEAKQYSYQFIKADNPANMTAIELREYIKKKGYDHEKYFIHSLGHPIGYVVHDIGVGFSSKSSDDLLLKEGMIISHEPGLYWQDKWGVRLEDDILVEKNKAKILTYCPKDPMLI